MKKEQIIKVLQKARESSKKRKFSQSFDLLVQLKNLDLKKNDQKVDLFLTLPHPRGKKMKICAFVDSQLQAKAEEAFDGIVLKSDFIKYKNKPKDIKKLAETYDFFVAQADLMGQLAGIFGKFLGSRGLMPNPKAGCVVPGNMPNLKPLAEKLQKTIRLQTKSELAIKVPLGLETLKDDEVADNVLAAYQSLLKALPQEKNNVKGAFVKLTMGPLFNLDNEKNTNVER